MDLGQATVSKALKLMFQVKYLMNCFPKLDRC